MADRTSPGAAASGFDKKSLVLGLVFTVVFDIGLAIAVFEVARAQGASEAVAYLLASVGPLVGMVVNWARTRKLGGVSIVILVTILISALVSLIGSQDAQVLLLKDSVLTGGFGLVTLVSALPLFGKPLMFYFGLKFGTDGSKRGIQEWYDLWDAYAMFRHGQYVINTVWGVSFLVEAAIKAICTLTLPYDAAYALNQILPFVVLAGVIFWTVRYGQKMAAEGAARGEAARRAELDGQAGPATPAGAPGADG